jgi:hypothetical protein
VEPQLSPPLPVGSALAHAARAAHIAPRVKTGPSREMPAKRHDMGEVSSFCASVPSEGAMLVPAHGTLWKVGRRALGPGGRRRAVSYFFAPVSLRRQRGRARASTEDVYEELAARSWKSARPAGGGNEQEGRKGRCAGRSGVVLAESGCDLPVVLSELAPLGFVRTRSQPISTHSRFLSWGSRPMFTRTVFLSTRSASLV